MRFQGFCLAAHGYFWFVLGTAAIVPVLRIIGLFGYNSIERQWICHVFSFGFGIFSGWIFIVAQFLMLHVVTWFINA